MNIVLLEPLGVPEEVIGRMSAGLVENGHCFTAYDTVWKDADELIQRAKNAEVLMLANHPLPKEAIEGADSLKYISVAFVGVDHIDGATCKEKSIPVSNAAGYCDDAVAELTMGLILDCLRNISACNRAIREEKGKDGLVGSELSGKTIGIIGTGAIGCRVAELLKAFGCKLLGYSKTERALAKAIGVEYVPLDRLLSESDIVTLHTPLNEGTRGMISKDRIAQMKPSAVLINTARGAIVDSIALADALNSGKIAGAGIDVFETEPPLDRTHPLLLAKNVIATPHVAFATKESIERRAAITFENVYRFFEGTVQNRVL